MRSPLLSEECLVFSLLPSGGKRRTGFSSVLSAYSDPGVLSILGTERRVSWDIHHISEHAMSHGMNGLSFLFPVDAWEGIMPSELSAGVPSSSRKFSLMLRGHAWHEFLQVLSHL